MTAFREALYNRMVALYGDNHEITNNFYELCENEIFPNDSLETLVRAHEEYTQHTRTM